MCCRDALVKQYDIGCNLLLFSLATEIQPGCQTKVSNLELHVVIQKQVAKFQITVNDLTLMQMLHTQQKLMHEVTSLRLSDSFSSLVKLHETL